MFCALNQLNKVRHVWPGSNDFHWMWVSIAIGQSNWPVELDLEELFFHLRAKGNEIGHGLACVIVVLFTLLL